MSIEIIFGSIAFITSLIGLLPQVYKAFKTKSTHDLSMIMIINYLCCSLAWIIYSININSMFVLASNIVGLLTSIVLIAQKQFYDKKTGCDLPSKSKPL
jgi:MtN3 and saliva related transmembrane protein